MSVENENNSQTLNDYKKTISDEKEKFGLKDEDDDDKSDEEKNDRDNMGGYPGTGDESENHRIKLSNERKQDYKDYLSNKNDNFTKPDEYFEDVNPDTFLGFGESQDRHERHKNVITAEKRQISHDQLADERKQEYQTHLSKTDVQFSKPDEYFEKINPDTFLGFGESQDRHERHKNVITAEKRQIFHDQLADERKQEYQTHLSKTDVQFSKPDEYFEKVNADSFLGFGETQDRHERHKNVILAEKRQVAHDQLDYERKQEYQTYLSKSDDHFSKPDEYFEKVNEDSFLEFGEGVKQPTHGTHGRKKVNLNDSRETTIEKLQNSLQQASISTYGSLNLSNLEEKNDDNKQLWKAPETPINVLVKEQQIYSQNQNDKSSNENVPELNAHQRYLAALTHSPLHNQIEEANSQMNREHNLQNLNDEKRRQHEQYSQELSQQIADKKQYNIVNQTEENYTQIQRKINLRNEDDENRRQCEEYNKQLDTEKASREQLEDEDNLPLDITDQITTEDDTQINRDDTEIMEQDEKNRKNGEYLDELCQQIEDNKQRRIATANKERLEDEASERYEHSHYDHRFN